MRKILPFIIAMLAMPFFIKAQVTTSSMSGFVKNKSGEILQGSSVEVTHVPTGTKYRTVTRKDGRFDLVNLIPGGPYTIDITFVGYKPLNETGLTLPLGESTRYDATLESNSTVLSTVVISAAGGQSGRRRTGASTNISRAQINALPTLTRSLQDYTRLTPQANGNSFGGMSNKFNNITIDGAVNNDVFGLSGTGTPGGQASTTPISLDAIQEIQVVLAPYDVSYGNFTGGGINAITRSGTNKFEGSVYYFLRNENTVGKDPVSRVKTTSFDDKQYGIRIGGPIIKNKLFFFLNGELARREAPTIFNAGDSNALLSKVDAQQLADTLRLKYGYDVGSADAFPAQTQSDKIFGRIDWNITSRMHLTLRHNYIKAFDDNISRSTSLFRYGNNTYRFNNKQNITVAEIRNTFSKSVSNNLIIGRHEIRDFRTTFGTLFPQVEINKGSGIIQLGTERSSAANQLDQDIFEITDNLKIFKGKNTFTIGTHNEFFKFRNLFINNANGRWRFNSLADFYNNNPKNFDVGFSADKAADPSPSAKFKASQLGFYIQDEIQVDPKLRITVGLRADMPIINSKPGYNPAVDSTFEGKYSTNIIPNKQLLWAPRIGFNYDAEGDRSIILRGGLGVFTGRVPFVWISNQFVSTGLLLKATSQSGAAVNGGHGFDPVTDQSSIGTGAPTYEVNVIDKKFKIPQVARLNLAVDRKLPGGVNVTVEMIMSKTLNNIYYQNVNLKDPTGKVDPVYNNGADTREAFGTTTATRNINPLFTRVILISNTSKGYAFNAGATINKTWKHFFVQASYNYNSATDVNSGASSTALSNWEFVQVVGNSNKQDLSVSNFELKHRFTGIFSVNYEFLKHLKTTLSFFYDGNSGQPFTYVVNGDLNSDNQFGNDLVYVPKDPSEIKFVDLLNSAGNAVQVTAAQQSIDFENFIQHDKYLSKRRGQYTERNGRYSPFEHVVDARLAQDIFINVGGRKHDIQISFDVFNLTNLINKDWGRRYAVTNQAYNLLTTINRTSGPFAGKGYNFNASQLPWGLTFASRWQGQIGFRYTFD